MDIASLKIVKAQKKAILLTIAAPLAILFVVMGYLTFTNYQINQGFSWSEVNIYILPLLFMTLFDAVLLVTIKKKTNVNAALAQFSHEQLTEIDRQCQIKVSLFKTPIVYTDEALFISIGLSLKVLLPSDLVWLKHQTSTGTVEIVTRTKQVLKIHCQSSAAFFSELVDKVKIHRPAILVSSNQANDEGRRLSELFLRDFSALIRQSDGKVDA